MAGSKGFVPAMLATVFAMAAAGVCIGYGIDPVSGVGAVIGGVIGLTAGVALVMGKVLHESSQPMPYRNYRRGPSPLSWRESEYIRQQGGKAQPSH